MCQSDIFYNKISLNLAQDIVNAVKEVVDKDINFIDKNGIIICILWNRNKLF